jgi:hypothetical protein
MRKDRIECAGAGCGARYKDYGVWHGKRGRPVKEEYDRSLLKDGVVNGTSRLCETCYGRCRNEFGRRTKPEMKNESHIDEKHVVRCCTVDEMLNDRWMIVRVLSCATVNCSSSIKCDRSRRFGAREQ